MPTLSEWGLGIFAALFGVAAVWALRRRAARA
ncbi:MAG: IPTL-CTERM sorting domain-containing protein [Thermodesulfobacteriota bacterium]